MKTFFSIKDNILDKRLATYIDAQTFVENRKTIKTKVDEIVTFYADNFTKSNKEEAERHF
jgi:hypothetical protein